MVIDEEVSRQVDTIRDNLYTVMKKMTMAQKSACRKRTNHMKSGLKCQREDFKSTCIRIMLYIRKILHIYT